MFAVCLPSLRERVGDIILLTQHFIREFNRKHNTNVEGAREETARPLNEYLWPGNVRELRNLIERAIILAKDGWIDPAHLPA